MFFRKESKPLAKLLAVSDSFWRAEYRRPRNRFVSQELAWCEAPAISVERIRVPECRRRRKGRRT